MSLYFQVSFSVNVSEIPRETIPSVSSEDDVVSEGRDQSLSPSVTSDDVAVEDLEGEPPPSPLSPISPTHSEKPKGPQPPPKPKSKEVSYLFIFYFILLLLLLYMYNFFFL